MILIKCIFEFINRQEKLFQKLIMIKKDQEENLKDSQMEKLFEFPEKVVNVSQKMIKNLKSLLNPSQSMKELNIKSK